VSTYSLYVSNIYIYIFKYTHKYIFKKYQKTRKEQDDDIVKVDDEIMQKQEILDQLKKDMELYRVFFDEYETLVKEKDSLEAEKQQLIVQMGQYEKNEKSADGKEGNKTYVLKLKEQLKSVENRLRLQSNEQKKREHAMELMKRDNSKCKELESSISTVKKMRGGGYISVLICFLCVRVVTPMCASFHLCSFSIFLNLSLLCRPPPLPSSHPLFFIYIVEEVSCGLSEETKGVCSSVQKLHGPKEQGAD
jgi:hypothetical protein